MTQPQLIHPLGYNLLFCNLVHILTSITQLYGNSNLWSNTDLFINMLFVSLRSKRFQSSYCAKVRAEAKKKVEGGGGGEKRKRLPANPTILENAP